MHVVITGSTRGIGRGLAEYFLNHNCKVTINGTTEENVKNTLLNLKRQFGGNVQGFAGKTNIYEEVETLYKKAQDGFGNIDIWINNAGIDQDKGLFKDIPMENYKKVIDINLLGVMNGSHVALSNMLKQGYGQIYNMEGYGSNDMMSTGMTIYGTSKRALTYFTKSLMKEVKGTKVQVSLLSPGMVLTDFLLKAIPKNNEKEAARLKSIYNTLADKPEVVTEFLGKEILKNKKNGAHIQWLTNSKAAWRFATAKISKRDLFK